MRPLLDLLYFFRFFNMICLILSTSKIENILHNNTVDKTEKLPPTIEDVKLPNIAFTMFATKWPSRLHGSMIKEYLHIVLIRSNLKLGMALHILIKLSKDMVVIDKKKETITELMPIRGVRATKPIISTIEPIM